MSTGPLCLRLLRLRLRPLCGRLPEPRPQPRPLPLPRLLFWLVLVVSIALPPWPSPSPSLSPWASPLLFAVGDDGCAIVSSSPSAPLDVHAAVLVWVDSDEERLARPITSYPPIPRDSQAFRSGGVPNLLQPFYIGVDLYLSSLQAQRDGRLPVLGLAAAQRNVTLHAHFINLGRVAEEEWDRIDRVTGLPVAFLESVEKANEPGGLFDRLVHDAPSLMCFV